MLDVNVLVSAMREDSPRHGVCKPFIEQLRRAPEQFGLSDLVPSGACRVRTRDGQLLLPLQELDTEVHGGSTEVHGGRQRAIRSPL